MVGGRRQIGAGNDMVFDWSVSIYAYTAGTV